MTIILLPVSSGPLTWYKINFEVVFAYLLVNFQFLLVTICVPSAPFLSRPVFGRLSFRCGLDVTDSCQWWPGFTPWLPPPPPPSADSSLGNHRPPGWRQPVRLRAGQPAQSIPLHFLSICSGLFINNYCLAELQCARWLGQGERLGDLSPPLAWLGSHRQTRGET